jgi:hypothetical protein
MGDKDMNTEVHTQTIITNSKSLIPEPGYFDRTRKKFDNWWRSIVLYPRGNKIEEADEKITAVIAYLRGATAGIYCSRKGSSRMISFKAILVTSVQISQL